MRSERLNMSSSMSFEVLLGLLHPILFSRTVVKYGEDETS